MWNGEGRDFQNLLTTQSLQNKRNSNDVCRRIPKFFIGAPSVLFEGIRSALITVQAPGLIKGIILKSRPRKLKTILTTHRKPKIFSTTILMSPIPCFGK